jgi:hypothetical protein
MSAMMMMPTMMMMAAGVMLMLYELDITLASRLHGREASGLRGCLGGRQQCHSANGKNGNRCAADQFDPCDHDRLSLHLRC